MAGSPLFDQINQVWTSAKELTTTTKPNSVYMTFRFISLHPKGIIPAADLNRMRGLPDWAALPALKFATPTYKNPPRSKYPKKLTQEKKLSPKRERALGRVCDKFSVSQFHGLQIMTLLEAQGFILEAN